MLSEDTAGAPAPLEPGSLVAGSPGYWKIAAAALSGVSTFGASLVAAANAAAAKTLLSLVKADVGLGNVDNTSDVNKPVSTAQATADGLRVLKAGDAMTGLLGITVASGSALEVTSTAGTGDLAIKARTTAATSANAQAGMDYGFSSVYRITQAVAGTGVSSPWGGSGYVFCQGVPMRLITDSVLRGIEFWPNSAYAGRFFNGVLQAASAAVTAVSASTGIAAYFGTSGSRQLRVGDLGGYCWTFGRNNGTGDLELSSTKNDGTDYVTNALTIGGGTGVLNVAFGAKIGGGTTLTKVVVYTPTLTPASVDAADGYVEQTFTVTGLAVTDTISVNQPVMNAPPYCQLIAFRVSAANTLAMTFHSVSGAHLPPQGAYRIIAFRS